MQYTAIKKSPISCVVVKTIKRISNFHRKCIQFHVNVNGLALNELQIVVMKRIYYENVNRKRIVLYPFYST